MRAVAERQDVAGTPRDVEFAGMEGDSVVKVRLTGACQGCPMSRVTLKEGIEKFVKSEIPTIRAVEAVE